MIPTINMKLRCLQVVRVSVSGLTILPATVAAVMALSLFLTPATLEAQQVDVYARPKQVERSRDYDAIHYRVSLSFDLDRQSFTGENLITLTPLDDGFQRCVLDAEELIVDRVRALDGREVEFAQTDRHLVIEFDRAYDFGDTVRVAVEYHLDGSAAGFFFDEETPDHPRMASTDSWADEAHHWIPLYDYPNDRVTHELIVEVDRRDKVLSNGRLVGVTDHPKDPDRWIWHWSQEQPHATYLMMVAVGPFAVIEDSLGDLPINYWVYPEDEEDARWIFEKTPRMVDFYSTIFDFEYPWAKYDQVTTPHVGGGAEATSATILGQGVIHDRRAEQDFSWERIIAHETAHQWWGDLITLREWSHTWMNESFGTYSDYLWTRAEWGEDEGALDLLGKKDAYLREAHNRYMRPIVFDRYERPGDNFDSHTYPKGACVLHMLRYILGDDPFFRTLSRFLHEHAFQPVDTHDFMTTVREVTGQNLDWFFEQYIFSPGHPVFEVESTWNEGNGILRLQVRQVQDTSKGIPIYTIPVVIGIELPHEKVSKEIWLREREQVFEIELSAKPLMVRFDEGNWLLKEWTFLKSRDDLLYQLGHDDVIGRMWAASELIRFGDDSAVVDALARRAQDDEFWAVRRSALETLGRTGEEVGRQGGEAESAARLDLYRQLSQDESSKVRVTALRLLGASGEADLVPFLKERFGDDDSYLAQAEALRSIGRCGSRSEVRFLERAARMTSHNDVIRRAAEWAIERIGGG